MERKAHDATGQTSSTSDVGKSTTLARHVGASLRAHGMQLATAESCTGGLIGELLTDVPGSSEYYLGGVIAYSNEIKKMLLDVSAETLASEGAVSAATAVEMAEGVRRRFGADVSVSVTGIAGPTGGGPSKPVGLVYIAVSTASGTEASRHQFSGSRSDVRAGAAAVALRSVLSRVDGGVS